ncbi:hypothetical protein GOV12_02190 [Candidatus Pacearchaeota archaeon]|nr:hypothetical protein [Candidatus Pacearchaeota archaeon]
MKNILLTIIIVVVVLILLVGLIFVFGNNESGTDSDDSSSNTDVGTDTDQDTNAGDEPSLDDTDSEVRTIVVSGENFKFMINGQDNPDIIVKEGDIIKIEFTSTGGFHDFVIDELGAKTDKINTGDTTTIEFVASKKGTFNYYCSVGNHRGLGMEGNIIVG